MIARCIVTLCLGLYLAAPAVSFDKVLMRDGRLIEGKLLDEGESGTVMLRLPAADIPIPMSLVDKVYVEDLENYVPKNKTEEEQIKKGRVLFEGSWMSRTRRESMLDKRRKEQERALEESKEDHDWRNHKTVKTRQFTIKSNCTDEVIEETATLLEQYYKAFVEFWNIRRDPSEKSRELTFYFYRTKADFHRDTGKPYNVGGYWSFFDRELRLYYNLQDPTEAREVLFHEGNHMLTYLIDTKFNYPTWMNEGMAEYYGTAVVDEKGEFSLGGLQFGRIVSLRNDEATGNVLRLRDVMMLEHHEFNARHYAAAWSFIHFLMESEEYGTTFKNFFKNMSKNRDLDITNVSYSNVKGSLAEPSLSSVCDSLERQIGKTIEELEQEWQLFQSQAYGDLDANAYFRAAWISLRNPLEGDEHVTKAMEYYARAIELGITNADCHRAFAKLLRVGGVDDFSQVALVADEDPVAALEVIEQGIAIDPVNPYNYLEAGEVLLVDGETQDLERALSMVETAQALAPTDLLVRLNASTLTAKIEPLRRAIRDRERLAEEMIANDRRVWTVQPFHFDGEPTPEQLTDLSTQDLRELILAGAVTQKDWAFQSYRVADPATGELVPGGSPWDTGWVQLSEIDVFAKELAQAAEGEESSEG